MTAAAHLLNKLRNWVCGLLPVLRAPRPTEALDKKFDSGAATAFQTEKEISQT